MLSDDQALGLAKKFWSQIPHFVSAEDFDYVCDDFWPNVLVAIEGEYYGAVFNDTKLTPKLDGIQVSKPWALLNTFFNSTEVQADIRVPEYKLTGTLSLKKENANKIETTRFTGIGRNHEFQADIYIDFQNQAHIKALRQLGEQQYGWSIPKMTWKFDVDHALLDRSKEQVVYFLDNWFLSMDASRLHQNVLQVYNRKMKPLRHL